MARRPRLTLSNAPQEAKEPPPGFGPAPEQTRHSRGHQQKAEFNSAKSKPVNPGKNAPSVRTRAFPTATMVKALLAVSAAAIAVFLLKRGFL